MIWLSSFVRVNSLPCSSHWLLNHPWAKPSISSTKNYVFLNRKSKNLISWWPLWILITSLHCSPRSNRSTVLAYLFSNVLQQCFRRNLSVSVLSFLFLFLATEIVRLALSLFLFFFVQLNSEAKHDVNGVIFVLIRVTRARVDVKQNWLILLSCRMFILWKQVHIKDLIFVQSKRTAFSDQREAKLSINPHTYWFQNVTMFTSSVNRQKIDSIHIASFFRVAIRWWNPPTAWIVCLSGVTWERN